jgi:hypothetical protein
MDEKPGEFAEEFSKFPLKKRRFLERYAETGSISMASQHAGVSRRTHLKWKAKDKAFCAAHEEALSIAVELMEHEARERALKGRLEPVYYAGKPCGAIRRYSDTLLIFLLKAARPEKYRDNYPGFAEPPRASREEVLNELHKKLARLAAKHTVMPPHNNEAWRENASS